MLLPLPNVEPLVRKNPVRTSYMRFRGFAPNSANAALQWPPLNTITPLLVCAVVKEEDRFFFRHHGWDVRAVLLNLARAARGEPHGGASTITQQLARNLYLAPSPTLRRKLRELVIARELERRLTKNRILELYLNTAEWGPAVWGASMATEYYFANRPDSADAFEASFLAAMLPAPRLAPVGENGSRVHRVQRRVLMQLANSGLLPRDDAEAALFASDQWYSAQTRGVSWRNALASAAAGMRAQRGEEQLPRSILSQECGLARELGKR